MGEIETPAHFMKVINKAMERATEGDYLFKTVRMIYDNYIDFIDDNEYGDDDDDDTWVIMIMMMMIMLFKFYSIDIYVQLRWARR